MDPAQQETLRGVGTFVLDDGRLQSLAQMHRKAYASADQFPHVVIDDFLSGEVLERVRTEIPRPGDIRWIEFEDARGKKLASKAETQLGAFTRLLLYQLNSSVFLDFLETLTRIPGLVSDPHFWGGGVHQIVRGGFLKIHSDFNRHPRLKLDRRLNLLLYLNPSWQEEWGGHLELWDRSMTECRQRILPVFGRCVIFSTTNFANHGHPDPLNCPEGETRKSLALYYYSNGRPREEVAGHHYSTLFRRRPGEKLLLSPQVIAQNLLPPIVMSLVSALNHRLRN
jgi:Rps23 Pro-64 3,4-dihydroxylase Tpa1-like proline 4-hydroxylase